MRTVPVQKNLRLATMGNEHSREDGEAGSRPSDGETDAMSGADDGYLSRGDTDDSDLSGEEQRRRKGFVVDPKFLNAALRGGSAAVATAVRFSQDAMDEVSVCLWSRAWSGRID